MAWRPALTRVFTVGVLIGLAALPILQAQQYSFRYYGGDQGLTNLAARVLFQDRTGFLWVSTENGLFRYDGMRFQEFGAAEGLPPSSALSLGEGPDGALLAGGDFGLYRKSGDRFEHLAMPGAKSVSGVSGIQSDGEGRSYIATDAGLVVATQAVASSNLTLRLLPAPVGVKSRGANSVLCEKDSVWFGCGTGLCRMNGDRTTVFTESDGLPAKSWTHIRRAGNGDLWTQDALRHGSGATARRAAF
jgi:ligand-binding sensor domain-containing protein